MSVANFKYTGSTQSWCLVICLCQALWDTPKTYEEKYLIMQCYIYGS